MSVTVLPRLMNCYATALGRSHTASGAEPVKKIEEMDFIQSGT